MPTARLTDRDQGAQAAGLLRRWLLRLAIAAVTLAVIYVLFTVAVRITTRYWWFDSVHAHSVYSREIWSKVLLFSTFGAVAALIGGLSIMVVRRARPRLAVDEEDDVFRAGFRRYEHAVGWLIVTLAGVVPGIRIGQRAAAQWQTDRKSVV